MKARMKNPATTINDAMGPIVALGKTLDREPHPRENAPSCPHPPFAKKALDAGACGAIPRYV